MVIRMQNRIEDLKITQQSVNDFFDSIDIKALAESMKITFGRETMNEEIKNYIVKVGSMYVKSATLDVENFSSVGLTNRKKEAQEIGFKDAMKVASATNGKIYALRMEKVTDLGEMDKG